MTTLYFLLFLLLSLAAVIFLRTRSNGKYEVKLNDVIICLVPFAIWMLISGKISELAIGDINLKLREEYEKPVETEITSLVGSGELIKIGTNCVYGNEEAFLDKADFPSDPLLRFILIEDNCLDDARGNSAPRFWGILDVDDYRKLFLVEHTKLGDSSFYSAVKARNIDELDGRIPSFRTRDEAIHLKTTKLDALKKMEKLNAAFLPVINDNDEFVGVLDRSSVTSSFIIEIGDALKK